MIEIAEGRANTTYGDPDYNWGFPLSVDPDDVKMEKPEYEDKGFLDIGCEFRNGRDKYRGYIHVRMWVNGLNPQAVKLVVSRVKDKNMGTYRWDRNSRNWELEKAENYGY